jgi:Kelch motif
MNYDDIPGRPRSSAGFVQDGARLYWAAGHLGEFHYYGRCHFSREFHCLDLDSGSWLRLADFPVPAQGFRMVSYNGGIYAFGGFVFEGDGEWPVRSSDNVWRYDIAINEWKTVAHLQVPRSSNVAERVGDLVYLIGGWAGCSKPNLDESSPWVSKPATFHTTVEVFDLKSQKVVEQFPLGIPPRRAFASVVKGSDITIACGLGPNGFADLKTEVMTFSTVNRKWTKLFDTPLGLFSPGLAWPAHVPLVIGGLFVAPDYSPYEEFRSIATFDPHQGGGWKEYTKLESSRTFAESAVWEETLVVLGGHSGRFPVSSVESFNAFNPGSMVKLTRLSQLRVASKDF